MAWVVISFLNLTPMANLPNGSLPQGKSTQFLPVQCRYSCFDCRNLLHERLIATLCVLLSNL